MRLPWPRPGRAPRLRFLRSARLDTLIDGVFAITLTLLVLDVRPPETLGPGGLLPALLALGPEIVSYVISFALLGVAWLAHHLGASLVVRSDFTHAALNLLALLVVALVPFSAALLSRYPAEPLAYTVFGVHVATLSLLYSLNWQHCARGHCLVEPDLPPGVAARITQMGVEATAGYLLMVPVAYFAARWSLALYGVLIVVALLELARLARLLEGLPAQEALPAPAPAHSDPGEAG